MWTICWPSPWTTPRDYEESCAAIAEALAGDPADDTTLEEYRARSETEREDRGRRRPPPGTPLQP